MAPASRGLGAYLLCRWCNGVCVPPLLRVGEKIHRGPFWPRARPHPPRNRPLCRFSLRSCTAPPAPPRSARVAHTSIVPQNCHRPCCACSNTQLQQRTTTRSQFRACPGPLSCATCWTAQFAPAQSQRTAVPRSTSVLISALNVIQHGALVGVARASLHGAVCAMVAVACAPVPVLGGGRFGGVGISRGY